MGPMRATRTTSVSLSLLAVVLAGCGGGDDDPRTSVSVTTEPGSTTPKVAVEDALASCRTSPSGPRSTAAPGSG
jgi:hypothetical protein